MRLTIFILVIIMIYKAMAIDENITDGMDEEDSETIEILSPPHSSSLPFRFLTLGDWGKSSNYGSRKLDGKDDDLPILSGNNNNNNNNKKYYQEEVAAAMNSYIKNINDDGKPCFIASLGDNFYKNGVSSATDSLWDSLFINVYIKPYSTLQIPWYPVFGNHDYGGGASYVQAQLDRTTQHIDPYWTMPSTNYSKIYTLPDTALLGLLFIDTTTLAPSENKCCNENGGISYEVQQTRIKNQLFHIEKNLIRLSKKNVQWIVVFGHYPIYSKGEHGDTDELVELLEPLFLAYKVNAYFSGHDHITEHLSRNGIEYFVTGAGSMQDKIGQGVNSEAKLNYYLEYMSAFGAVEVSAKTFTVDIYDTTPNKVYSYTMTNPRSVVNVTKEVVDHFFDDAVNFDDDNDAITVHRKRVASIPKAVFLSVGSFLAGVLLVNCIRVRYKKRKSKLRRAINKITLTSPDSALLRYNDYDYNDIEMMNKFKEDLYNIPDNNNNTDTESVFRTSTSFNSTDNAIFVNEVSYNETQDGIIYSKPKHIRAQTVAF